MMHTKSWSVGAVLAAVALLGGSVAVQAAVDVDFSFSLRANITKPGGSTSYTAYPEVTYSPGSNFVPLSSLSVESGYIDEDTQEFQSGSFGSGQLANFSSVSDLTSAIESNSVWRLTVVDVNSVSATYQFTVGLGTLSADMLREVTSPNAGGVVLPASPSFTFQTAAAADSGNEYTEGFYNFYRESALGQSSVFALSSNSVTFTPSGPLVPGSYTFTASMTANQPSALTVGALTLVTGTDIVEGFTSNVSTGGQITLNNLTVVPEPAAMGMLPLAAAVLVRRRR